MLAFGPIYQAGLGEMVVGGSRWPAGGGWSVVPFFWGSPSRTAFQSFGEGREGQGMYPVHAVQDLAIGVPGSEMVLPL